jgi:hypothetical protein
MIKDILVNLSYGTSQDGVSNCALLGGNILAESAPEPPPPPETKQKRRGLVRV